MAGNTPFVLPQYQGSMYDLQRQQALANALMQGAMTPPQAPQAVGSGPYTVAPHMSALAPLSSVAQGLLANKIGQQAGQGLNQLGQNQWQSLIGALGGGAAAQSPQLNPGSADGGVGGAGSIANPFLGADGSNGTPGTATGGPVNGPAAGPQLANNVGAGGSPLNPLGINPTMAAMMMMQSPDKYWETQAAAYKPADIVQQIRAAGIDPQSALGRQIAQQALAKANYIAPVSLRPGGYMYDPMSGNTQQMPQVPEGFTAVKGQNGQWQIVPVQGGLEAMGSSAAAQAGGKAQYQLTDVWDPTANGGQGGMVHQSVANTANAANGIAGGAPTLTGIFAQQESSGGRTAPNNPLQIQQGTFNQFAQKGESWNNPADRTAVAQRVLAGYSQKYGGDLGRIATAYFSGEGNVAPAGSPTPFIKNTSDSNGKSVASYVGDILGRAGGSGFGGGSPARQGGPMASQPPLGTTQATNTAQNAPSKQMGDSYARMSDADGSYQASRDALTGMLNLANKKGASGAAVGVLPASIGTKISPEAAEYQKLHATYVAAQGKALGSGGTDAARATIDEAVPTYDKPQSAMVSGLQTQLNNLDMAHLKTQFLNPTYQKGDEKTFTAQSAAFDSNIKPSMMPILQMQGDQQRAAVQAAIKANPSLRTNFEWAYNNGMLK